jgi:hypothetical protein
MLHRVGFSRALGNINAHQVFITTDNVFALAFPSWAIKDINGNDDEEDDSCLERKEINDDGGY